MGARYQCWLIAKGNTFAPGAAAIAKLIERLRADRWIPASGGSAVRTIDNTFGEDAAAKAAASTEPVPDAIGADWLDAPQREEMRLVWSIEVDRPEKYPLSQKPARVGSYSLELHRAPEYVYPVSETIEPLDAECRCGEDLAFEWDEDEVVPAFTASAGIFAECEECSRTFDPSTTTATITNPFDGSEEEIPGGAAYRFALKVDCGKTFAADAKLAFSPELVALVEEVFGRAFYEVGSTY